MEWQVYTSGPLSVFDIARGSALKCAACFDVLAAKKQITQVDSGKAILVRIVSMLVGLIRSTSSSRVHENLVDYGTPPARESDYDYDYDYD